MDVNTFRDKIKLNFKDVDANFFSQIEKYKLFLQDYNKKINLTRLADEEKIYGQYFFESVIPYRKFIFEPNISILDIGSGSGIPGIALLLLFPKIKLTIIESNNKKCSFLAALAKHLGIDVEILCKRAEDITASEREKFDLVTSRAVAPLKNILELSIPYTKING
jgi:16S rRNA (guanine527-N7)-methyltransferase